MNAFALQPLESRKLMAAVTATLASGRLTVTGTTGADLIYLESINLPDDSKGVNVYGGEAVVGTFALSKIRSVLIDGKAGNDNVGVDGYIEFSRTTPVSLFGNSGDDRLTCSSYAQVVIDGGIGNDRLYGEGLLRGGKGNDHLIGYLNDDSGQAFDQLLSGDEGNDTLEGQGGRDYIDGGADDDTIYTRFAYETATGRDARVNAGAGNDIVYVNSPGTYHLDAGNDTVVFGPGKFDDRSDTFQTYFVNIYGDEGNDRLDITHKNTSGNIVSVSYYGDEGDDTLNASAASLVHIHAWGDTGRDTLVGSPDNDVLYGGHDNDRLDGLDGYDQLYGNTGNDTLFGRGGDDTLAGDWFEADPSGRPDGNDILDGGSGQDSLYGNGGNDDLFGGDGKDLLDAGSGTNRLFGQGGTDTLNSKNGQVDKLYATSGDVLNKDTFDQLLA